MRKSVMICLVLCTLIVVALAPRWVTRVSAKLASGPNQFQPGRALDAKAVRAQAGDEASIRELALGIFEPFGWANRGEIRGRVMDRVVKAELAYRSGQHPAVPEENVVNVVNNLAQGLALPDYAMTSVQQVRYLRTSLMVSAPHLVAAVAKGGDDKQLPRVMSPMEATYVTLSLVHQKLYNPRFQEPGDGWLERRHREDLERWNKRTREDRGSGPRLVSEATPRAAEMRQAIMNAITLQAPGVSPDRALDDLGVSR